jgi:hypothetical protein
LEYIYLEVMICSHDIDFPFTHPATEPFFLALRCSANPYALFLMFHRGLEINTICPEINIILTVQAAPSS